ncbi:DNA repair exonuclease [Peptoniphilus sp. AGMB00490]|uniref:DNA repair exonuclease n=2 Tax=Peptoniphilus TaxID=162289 RepID=A0A848RHE3_9FIRM|nr:DNA repair exonuclease [Peptoniphilus faecalis]NMW84853.1 DNA repair exonuclease [Peptoniphilus faecalis]
MKIIHAADLHLKKFYKGRLPLEISNKLLEDTWRTFRDVANFSNEVDADIFLIAGDLFEREFFYLRDLRRFLNIIEDIKAKVFLVFGNHDYLSKDNLFLKVDLPENLYIFNSELDFYELKDLNTRIYGISYDSYKFKKDFSDVKLDKNFINIGLFHSDLKDERYMPLDEKFLREFNYVALGHIHKRAKVFNNAYYSGSLISLSFKDEGERGIIFLDDEKKTIEFKNFSRREFINLEIKIDKDMTFSEILKKVQGKISTENLYRITLKGVSHNKREIESFLRENLSAFYFEVINEITEERNLDFEIKDKYILDLLGTFSNSDIERDAREISKNYILEQYYGI